MTPLVAHAGHWLMGLGFASAPLAIIAGVAVIAIRDRRGDSDRGERQADGPCGPSSRMARPS